MVGLALLCYSLLPQGENSSGSHWLNKDGKWVQESCTQPTAWSQDQCRSADPKSYWQEINVYCSLLLSLGFFLTQQDLTNTGGISLEVGIGMLRSFSGGVVVKNPPANAGDARDIPCVRKIPWRSKWQCNPVFLPGNFHRQRSLAGYSPWGHKELDTTERLSSHTHTHSHTHTGTLIFLKVETEVPRK